MISDHFLQLIDPGDRKSEFFAAAEAWKKLANITNRPRQKFEQYWIVFGNASITYMVMWLAQSIAMNCRPLKCTEREASP